jgi:hypothetical protein
MLKGPNVACNLIKHSSFFIKKKTNLDKALNYGWTTNLA